MSPGPRLCHTCRPLGSGVHEQGVPGMLGCTWEGGVYPGVYTRVYIPGWYYAHHGPQGGTMPTMVLRAVYNPGVTSGWCITRVLPQGGGIPSCVPQGGRYP